MASCCQEAERRSTALAKERSSLKLILAAKVIDTKVDPARRAALYRSAQTGNSPGGSWYEQAP